MSLIRITRFAEAAPVVEVHHHTTGGGANNFKVRIAVEIPLMVLAISAVVLRLYSRMAVKRKCAIDDILIVCGLVSTIHTIHTSIHHSQLQKKNREHHLNEE